MDAITIITFASQNNNFKKVHQPVLFQWISLPRFIKALPINRAIGISRNPVANSCVRIDRSSTLHGHNIL